MKVKINNEDDDGDGTWMGGQPQLLDSVLRRRASWLDKYAGGKTVFNQVRRTAQQNILDVAPLPEVWSPGHFIFIV